MLYNSSPHFFKYIDLYLCDSCPQYTTLQQSVWCNRDI